MATMIKVAVMQIRNFSVWQALEYRITASKLSFGCAQVSFFAKNLSGRTLIAFATKPSASRPIRFLTKWSQFATDKHFVETLSVADDHNTHCFARLPI
jgi:hypothetical protein